MSRIVRGGLYMYSNRHRLNARDRYTRKEKDGRSARAGVCIRQKNHSPVGGLSAQSSGLNTWLTFAHMSVSPGVRHMRSAD